MRAQIRAEVWQILTPDQQQQAKTLQAQMEQRMQQGRQQHQKKQRAGAVGTGRMAGTVRVAPSGRPWRLAVLVLVRVPV